MLNLTYSSNAETFDYTMIHNYLCNQAYWSKGRSMEVVKTSIENSFCLAVFENEKQIGFARVITDYVVFGWIMDVFILDEFKGKGVGLDLMTNLLAHQELKNVQKWGLATVDAVKFYKKLGFSDDFNGVIPMRLAR